MMEQQIRQKMIRGARWLYICWTWMFSTLCMSPMFGARGSISDISGILGILALIFAFLSQLLRFSPPFLLVIL